MTGWSGDPGETRSWTCQHGTTREGYVEPQANCRECGGNDCRWGVVGRRDYLVVRFDVTDLDEEARGRLAFSAVVQAEGDDDFPGCPEPTVEWEEG